MNPPARRSWTAYARKHLNFYRIHLLAFTFIPLICSGIFYASNGQYEIPYIDALFNSVSAMTVCGLATVDLSSLTPWQQALLFIQMCLGSPVLIAWITVYVRRHFFAKQFESALRARLDEERQESKYPETPEGASTARPLSAWSSRLSTVFRSTSRGGDSPTVFNDGVRKRSRRASIIQKLRPDMIRRMDDIPRPINPSGHVSEHRPATPPPTPQTGNEDTKMMFGSLGGDDVPLVSSPAPIAQSPTLETVPEAKRTPANVPRTVTIDHPPTRRKHSRNNSDPGVTTPAPSPTKSKPANFSRFKTIQPSSDQYGSRMPRTQTVEFALLNPPRKRDPSTQRELPRAPRRGSFTSNSEPSRDMGVHRTMTDDRRSRRGSMHTYPSVHSQHAPIRSRHTGYGGFPLPHILLARAFVHFFPGAKRAFERTVTIPRTTTLHSAANSGSEGGGWGQRYFSFDVFVGRNSAFPLLSNEQLEEIGGVEYRALNALLWIVAGYHIGTQLIAFIIIAPYISQSRWSSDFTPPALHKVVSPVWFSLFNVVSAYTNTGMSLVDQSMTPFQQAYGMILPLIFLIFAGNTAFPVFLRFTIWIMSKMIPTSSRLNETLHFLLDHPRRCFLYLFPSHQTWFLLTVLAALNATDWFFFLVLDIGNPALETIPLGTRFAIGLLQAAAVRAAGFGTVTLAALAPAVKVLYCLMMYVSVYPIAMSVRSTNVYEEQSLGIFEEEDDHDENDESFQATGHRVTIWSRYLAMHARRQLSFDMWWLGLALFLVCIIERDALEDERSSYFTIFNILFELVSAYGSVGLSLGLPYANYSFSGGFRPLSKLIVCAVMLRGRHRGLPVAIDRAVMLPAEFRASQESLSEKRGSQDVPDTAATVADPSAEGRHSNGSAMPRTATRGGMSTTNGGTPGLEGILLMEKGVR